MFLCGWVVAPLSRLVGGGWERGWGEGPGGRKGSVVSFGSSARPGGGKPLPYFELASLHPFNKAIDDAA